ncbi:MAG: acyl-CoA dehydrogenase [Thiotrichales bacterium]|nr:acyl-CoA dehydrogenase [Thiotrichales bacterium]|tara:strand:+ start:377 stop:1435 length:1059 start_codon:yes stop_codon:yes gene_type:complete
MTRPDPAILDALEHMLDAQCDAEVLRAADGSWAAELWQHLNDAGVPRTWIPETQGGAGASWFDGLGVCRVAARYAAPVPLAETLLAAHVLHANDVTVPAGVLNVVCPQAYDSLRCDRQGRLHGELNRVAYGRVLDGLVVVFDDHEETRLAVLPGEVLGVTEAENLAGEPADQVFLSEVLPSAMVAVPADTCEFVKRVGATLRCQQMAGALEHLLSRSIAYASTREQFGRPVAKFQAVQHNLADLAGEVSASCAAANAAGSSIARCGVLSDQAFVAVASAKIRSGQAASNGASIAHQVHGAMGFAREYPLHHYSRRLWVWRDDFGAETEWAETLGQFVAQQGADALWPTLTAI